MNWQKLEEEVRAAATSKWKLPCTSQTIHGVRCDAVINYRHDYLILIEISRKNTLNKLREDLTKHSLMRTALMAEKKYAECYFITEKNESSLVESGKSLNVEVLSVEAFSAKFVGSAQYVAARRRKIFGSAVDPDSGEPDRIPYIPIHYVDSKQKRYTTEEISKLLVQGRHIVLQGEFGTGKSRCLWQVFEQIAKKNEMFVPIAINLRDNWGYMRFHHIIQNHLDSMGLGTFQSSMVSSLIEGRHVVLLDGFDEIGSQSWTGDPARLSEVRMQSHTGVRDLINECRKCGILITGREHYFNSEQEMRDCLGLAGDYISLRCPDEFTEDEIRAYLIGAVGIDAAPEWMPKKPLICRLLARLDKEEIERIHTASNGEVDFFENVLDAICEREKLINTSTTADAIKRILLSISQDSRKYSESDEKISMPEINSAFMDATGVPPIDKSAILLQRLPYLGRFSGESTDRKFVDTYAKDGLRGLAFAASIAESNPHVGHSNWRQPLGLFGVQAAAHKMSLGQAGINYIRDAVKKGNNQAGCDYVSIQNLRNYKDIDYGRLNISSGTIENMTFSQSEHKNLTLDGVYIDRIILDDPNFINVHFIKCIINIINGAGRQEALPEAFERNCHIERYETALSAARISEMNLSKHHKTLISLIKKLFFQPGAGRQEEALLRGAEAYWDVDAADFYLRYMIKNGLVTREKGDHGWIYVPKRRYTRRMGHIMDARSASKDELWNLFE